MSVFTVNSEDKAPDTKPANPSQPAQPASK